MYWITKCINFNFITAVMWMNKIWIHTQHVILYECLTIFRHITPFQTALRHHEMRGEMVWETLCNKTCDISIFILNLNLFFFFFKDLGPNMVQRAPNPLYTIPALNQILEDIIVIKSCRFDWLNRIHVHMYYIHCGCNSCPTFPISIDI